MAPQTKINPIIQVIIHQAKISQIIRVMGHLTRVVRVIITVIMVIHRATCQDKVYRLTIQHQLIMMAQVTGAIKIMACMAIVWM